MTSSTDDLPIALLRPNTPEAELQKSVDAIKQFGGRVLLESPREFLIADISGVAPDQLAQLPTVQVQPAGAAGFARVDPGSRFRTSIDSVWSASAKAQQSRMLTPRQSADHTTWDKAPGGAPDLSMSDRALLEDLDLGQPQEPPGLDWPVLVGSVAVVVVFVESSGDEFKISNTKEVDILSGAITGLLELSDYEPDAHISWQFDVKYVTIESSSHEFTNAPKEVWLGIWRDSAMDALGYGPGRAGVTEYVNSLKAAYDTGAAVVVFVTRYPSGSTKRAFALRNHVVMNADQIAADADYVFAHEIAHCFGALDEYNEGSDKCLCELKGGHYRVSNRNCINCPGGNSVPCLMKGNSPAVCDYTRGQLGWNHLAIRSTGSFVLPPSFTFDLENGVSASAAGADFRWSHVNSATWLLRPLNGAAFAKLGVVDFDALSLPTLKNLPYTTAPIGGGPSPNSELTPTTVIAIRTSAGRLAKLLTLGPTGDDFRFRWVTYKYLPSFTSEGIWG